MANAGIDIRPIGELIDQRLVELLSSPPSPQFDGDKLTAFVERARRAHGRREIEIPLHELRRAMPPTTPINGDAVSNIGLSSLDVGASNAPTRVTPWSGIDPAPLWTLFGRITASVDMASGVSWPTGTLGGEQTDEKVRLPTPPDGVLAKREDIDPHTFGLTFDLSWWAYEIAKTFGREAMFAELLEYETLYAAERYLGALIESSATLTGTTLAEAFGAVTAPHAATIVAAPIELLFDLDVLKLNALGVQIVTAPTLTKVTLLARSAVDAVRTEVLAMARDEPERAGLLLGAATRVGAFVDPKGLATVVTP